MSLIRYILLTLAGALYSSLVFSELLLTPQEIEMRDILEPEKVFVTYEGKPVPAEEITKILAGVHKTGDELPRYATGKKHFSNYSYMFKFETGDDGSITLTANRDLLQIGIYDLYVHTMHGIVTGRIDANLKDSTPTRPRYRSHNPRVTFSPGQRDYLYGRVISIDLGTDKVNTYTWSIDGEIHSSGLGLTSLRAWPEPGNHKISVVSQNPDNSVVSKWSETFSVVKEEPLRSSVRKGNKVSFRAPGGYARASWYYDGKLISEHQLSRSEQDAQSVTFKKRGEHTVTCKIQDSEDGNFRLITWLINVN